MSYSYNASGLENKPDPDKKDMPRKKFPTLEIDEADVSKIFGKIPEEGDSVTLTAFAASAPQGGKMMIELDIEREEEEDTNMDEMLGYEYGSMTNPKPVPAMDAASLAI